MLQRYRTVFAAPGTWQFCAAGVVMRLPISMYPIGLVLLIAIRTGHYGAAGALTGVYIIGGAIGLPVLARFADRRGQRRALGPSAAAHVLACAVLVVLVQRHVGVLALAAPAFAMGFSFISVGSLIRARWSHLLAGTPELGTAYSLESTLDEVVFVLGPLIASVLAVQVDPVWVLVLGAALVALGAAWLRAQTGTEPPVHGTDEPSHGTVLAARGMVLLTLAMVGMGGVFGAVEVTMAAFAGQHGARGRTGLVLAMFAFGSAVAGLIYGARHWQAPMLRRYWSQSLAFAALIPLLLAAGSVDALLLVAFVVGLGIAPSLITGFGLVESLVPTRMLTEGLAWLTTGLNVGYGVLASTVGRVADRQGAHDAFWLAVAAGAFVAVCASALALRLRAAVGVA
jgi:Major Facilitator Superfamily